MKNDLTGGEVLVLKANMHWFLFVFPLIVFLIGAALYDHEFNKKFLKWLTMEIKYYKWYTVMSHIYPIMKDHWPKFLGYVFQAAGFLGLIRAVFRKFGWRMYITNLRVVINRGIFTTKTIELYYNNIESIDVQQPFMGKFLNFGHVFFNATGYGALVFPMVSNPAQIKLETLETIRKTVTGQEVEGETREEG